jgi:uncharacterized protein with HEPN domain
VTAARDHRDLPNDMVMECRSIIRFVEGMTLDGYLADEKTRYAVMRGYEILGEVVRHLPASLKAANSDISRSTMAAVRNRIVHGHFGIDDPILFTTIEQDLKAKLPRLEALARAHGVVLWKDTPLIETKIRPGVTHAGTPRGRFPAVHADQSVRDTRCRARTWRVELWAVQQLGI